MQNNLETISNEMILCEIDVVSNHQIKIYKKFFSSSLTSETFFIFVCYITLTLIIGSSFMPFLPFTVVIGLLIIFLFFKSKKYINTDLFKKLMKNHLYLYQVFNLLLMMVIGIYVDIKGNLYDNKTEMACLITSEIYFFFFLSFLSLLDCFMIQDVKLKGFFVLLICFCLTSKFVNEIRINSDLVINLCIHYCFDLVSIKISVLSNLLITFSVYVFINLRNKRKLLFLDFIQPNFRFPAVEYSSHYHQ